MTTRPQFCLASAVFRIYACGLGVMTWAVAFNEDRSLAFLIARSGEGAFVANMMLVCGLIGLVDVVLNDLLLFPFRLECTRTHRHFGFSALAFCYVCEAFLAALTVRSFWMAAFNLWNALSVVAFSLIDAHQRSKESTCLRACN